MYNNNNIIRTMNIQPDTNNDSRRYTKAGYMAESPVLPVIEIYYMNGMDVNRFAMKTTNIQCKFVFFQLYSGYLLVGIII